MTKPDKRYEIYCSTCRQITSQAHIDGLEYFCSICCEIHEIPEPDNATLLHQLLNKVEEDQRVGRKILNDEQKRKA
jgi:hypothetical protein